MATPCANCGSLNFKIRRKSASNGASLVAAQCLNCGHKHGNWIKHESISLRGKNVADLEPWDEALSEAFWSIKNQQVKSSHAQELALKSAEWRQKYNAHLASPEWQALRKKVMQRANFECEGCGDAHPTQVHHLTYIHLGNELLWELVAVCQACHEAAHAERA